MFLIKQIIIVIISVVLASCGGGGGSPGTVPGSGANPPASGGGSGSGGTLISTANILKLVVQDASNSLTHAVNYGGNQRLYVTYTQADGKTPIAYAIVTFSVTAGSTLASLSTNSALTDENGTASAVVNAINPSNSGAATVQVSATIGGVNSTASVDFGVSSVAVTLTDITVGSTNLAASGNTPVTISASANDTGVNNVPISLNANCGRLDPAIPLTTGNGIASATYSAVKSDGTSCSGRVTITAIASGASKTSTLNVSPPMASAVNFVSANPSAIYLPESGATSQAMLKFQVLDTNGQAYRNAPVRVDITNNPGGVSLAPRANAQAATKTLDLNSDSKGEVNFTIYAGTIPGPVVVKVALINSETNKTDLSIYGYSNKITVQSGPPAQERFSLSVETYNIEGQNVDGTTTKLKVQAADRQGNAIPDGTVINFTSRGGQVQPSCTTLKDQDGISSCQVTFSSQNPRPDNGRVVILAYAEGVKTYLDLNGNNVFDLGETLTDMGDAYRDDDESGSFNVSEFVLTRGGTSTCTSSAMGKPPSRANTCDPNTAATTVRAQTVLLMASSTAVFTLDNANTSPARLVFRANSNTDCKDSATSNCLLPLSASTTFKAEVVGSKDCTAGEVSPATVGNRAPDLTDITAQLGTVHTVILTAADGKTCKGATVRVTATAVHAATSQEFTIQ
jgi:hypothetical protein